MTPPNLSDDMRDWPDDPFALLGVEPGAADTDLKRAYTRLVRRFKPEHHPDEFRRIREAYEFCLERSAWYRPDPDEPPGPEPERTIVVRDPPVGYRPGEPAAREPVIDEGVKPAPPLDPVEEAWEAALVGNEADAYAALVRLHDQDPDRQTIPLRLYWLLALNPPLDPARTRHRWLAIAVVRGGLRGPAAELYRRELEANPREALDSQFDDGPYTRVLAAPASASDLLTVARWRIAAAGRVKWFTRMLADLRLLRETLPLDDEPGWLGLLVLATGWTAWADHLEFDQFVKAEMRTLSHLQLSHAPLFDRLEETELVAKDGVWGQFSGVPASVVELVRIAWADSGYARPTEVELAAADLTREGGGRAQHVLGNGCFKNPLYLILVCREFEYYLRTRGLLDTSEFPPDLLRGLIRRTDLRRLGLYVSERRRILDLLVAHAVDPVEFAAALAEDPSDVCRGYAGQLHEDIALRVVWLAHRVQTG